MRFSPHLGRNSYRLPARYLKRCFAQQQAQAALSAAFERVEEERVGHGRHEAFHALMDRLREEYGA